MLGFKSLFFIWNSIFGKLVFLTMLTGLLCILFYKPTPVSPTNLTVKIERSDIDKPIDVTKLMGDVTYIRRNKCGSSSFMYSDGQMAEYVGMADVDVSEDGENWYHLLGRHCENCPETHYTEKY